MNSDEHMGQICVRVRVCLCLCARMPFIRAINARPAALLSLCPSLTPLHPSGRRHPDSVNDADSNRLHRRLDPAPEEMRQERRVSDDGGGGER